MDKSIGKSITQDEAEVIIDSIYTSKKKAIWKKEMDEAGQKFENGEMSFDEFMDFRRALRKRLGFPA